MTRSEEDGLEEGKRGGNYCVACRTLHGHWSGPKTVEKSKDESRRFAHRWPVGCWQREEGVC